MTDLPVKFYASLAMMFVRHSVNNDYFQLDTAALRNRR